MGQIGSTGGAKWDDDAGRRWVALQETLDALFQPIERTLVAGARAQKPANVLDVGCGPGGLSHAILAEMGPTVRCLGVDISEPMIDAARRAAEGCDFLCADAQTHAFEAGRFERIVSRFGVMFFSDPVAAFANLRHAAAKDGALDFMCWRSLEENPFMTVAERAVGRHLPDLSPNQDDQPGQFGLADAARIERLLSAAGWREISVTAFDTGCALPLAALPTYATQLGTVGRVFGAAPPETQSDVARVLDDAFKPWIVDGAARFTAACWRVTAGA